MIHEIEKFNPYHGPDGRFASANGATSFSANPETVAGRNAIERAGKEHPLILLAYDNLNEAGGQEKEQAPKSTAKQGLEKGLGKEHAEAVEKLIHDNAPKAVCDMWDKHGDQITVADAGYTGTAYSSNDGIHLNVAADAAGQMTRTGKPARSPYQTTIHESAHAIDDAISAKLGYQFVTQYNGGYFEKLLIQESNDYIKNYQKKLQGSRGSKVSIDEARRELARSLFTEGDYLSTGMLSDILGGATKGKFQGTSGHSKSYWTGWKDYFGNVHAAHSVATEAWAHFTSTAANGKSAARLKEVFPKSYGEYLSMCEFAATL